MDDRTDSERAPNPVDIHVGARVRMRRKMKGVSQETLANQLKLTFQQVQKYERGSNRISASKLYEIARALETPVAWFFEGLADTTGGEGGVAEAPAPFMHEAAMTPEGGDLITAFGRVRRRRMRKRIVELVRAIADEDEGEPEAA